jgi:hypothetical protein
MAKRKNPDEGKIYRLRDPKTGLFHGFMRMSEPTFTKRGKNWKTLSDVTDKLVHYNYEGIDKNWPELEIVIYEMTETGSVKDQTPNLRGAQRFIRKLLPNEYCSTARFVCKMAAQGISFRYLVHARGNHPVPAIDAVRVQRNSMTEFYDRGPGIVAKSRQKGETLVALDSETDLLFLKMQLHDSLIGIWDYKKCSMLDKGIAK